MKAKLICFSQSGNTQSIAQDIAAGIGNQGDECEIVDMLKSDPAHPLDCDLLGIGSPVFYYKEPFHVADFIDALPAGEGRHAFVFVTHGSVPGIALESMWKRLADKGYLVLGAHGSYADGAIPFYPHPVLTTGHPDAQDHLDAVTFGEEISVVSNRVVAGDSSLIPEPITAREGWWQEEARMISPEVLSQVFPQMTINQEKCIQCMACEQECPVAGIGVLESSPRIQDPCVYCFHCAKICPEVAIEADWAELIASAPETFERYGKVLADAEARGEFPRRYVDPDSINFDLPYVEQRKRKLAERNRAEE